MVTRDERVGDRDYLFIGEATVSVALTVQASSFEEAMAMARAAMENEWECDEVDGTVTIIEADGEPVPKKRRRLKSTSTFRIPPREGGLANDLKVLRNDPGHGDHFDAASPAGKILAEERKKRSGGVSARDYVRHIPKGFPANPVWRTFCGRLIGDVNCVTSTAEADASDVCLSCAKRLAAKGRFA